MSGSPNWFPVARGATGRHASRLRVGALQKANPLPAGLYWIDVIDIQNEADFAAWLLSNAASVKVLAAEHHDELSFPDHEPSRDWVKFQVLSPVAWDAKQFGFPNIIAPGEVVNSSTDTASGIEPSPDDCDETCKLERAAMAVGAIAVGAIVIAIVVRR